MRHEIREWLDQYSNSNTEDDVIQFWKHKSLSLKPIDKEMAKLAQFSVLDRASLKIKGF